MTARPFCVVPARGGSKRFPRKNIAPLRGKPLLAWTVEPALESGIFDAVHVSSEDDEILEVAERVGAVPIRRPEELGGDRVGAVDVVLHAADAQPERPDALYMLLPSSPLRRPETFRRAWALFVESAADALLSVVRVEPPPEWALVRRNGLIVARDPAGHRTKRQDLEDAWRHDGAHAIFRTDVLAEVRDVLLPRTVPLEVPEDEAVDVDEPDDLELAEFHLARALAR
jgi:CMP-N-acetylneuraminic acid synthetase